MLVVANCQRARSLVIQRSVYAQRKSGAIALARIQQTQAAAAAQRVGGRGHRLETDEGPGQRREDLRARIAPQKRELDPSVTGRDGEAGRLGHGVEAVVELALAKLEALGGECLPGADRYLVTVELQMPHRGQLDQPMLARNALGRQVRMEAKRQRNDVVSTRMHGHLDLESSVGEARFIEEVVAERKNLEQLRL